VAEDTGFPGRVEYGGTLTHPMLAAPQTGIYTSSHAQTPVRVHATTPDSPAYGQA